MKTKARKHTRRTKHGRSNVKRHFRNRRVKLKEKYHNLNELKADYVRAGYENPPPGMTAPHGADVEFILPIGKNKREHHRIYEEKNDFKIESHIDQVDPQKDPAGHVAKDVVAPEINHKLREENFNDTQHIKIKKK